MRLPGFLVLATFLLGLTGSARADDVVDGRFGPGALYRLVRPTLWNGAYIENIGVRPDIAVDYMTRWNLLSAGAPFVQAFIQAIEQLVTASH